MSYLPKIDERLVAALATQFPERSADLDWSEKEVWFKAGQCDVVRWLAQKLEEQAEGVI